MKPTTTAGRSPDPPGQSRSEPALAPVSVQGDAQRGRLGPGFELVDPLVLSRLLAMHGVLETHQKLLQMRDPRFQRLDRARVIG
jgi:hypothetical protein